MEYITALAPVRVNGYGGRFPDRVVNKCNTDAVTCAEKPGKKIIIYIDDAERLYLQRRQCSVNFRQLTPTHTHDNARKLSYNMRRVIRVCVCNSSRTTILILELQMFAWCAGRRLATGRRYG